MIKQFLGEEKDRIMTILFSYLLWWEAKESRGFLRKKRWRRGVRAGSRWPFTYLGRCTPDNPRAKDYIPYPFFLGYSTTYTAKEIGKDEVYFRAVSYTHLTLPTICSV